MSKKEMKRRISATQDGTCALSLEELPEHPSLVDTDRKQPKAEGGIYTDENTRVVLPMVHMERHGNLRKREEHLDQLKTLVDDRGQVMKLKNKINNQLLAYLRHTDKPDSTMVSWLEKQRDEVSDKLKEISKQVEVWIKENRKSVPLINSAMNVKGVGPITVAYLSVYVDLNKAEHPSSLWAYVGYDKPSHKRYEKGVAGGGNKTLRTVLYTTAESFIKLGSPYREVYDRTKARLAASENVVSSRNTQGKLVEVMWKDAKPSHRHGSAMRVMMKHFLADYWLVGRTLAGLPTTPLYVEERLGHKSIVQPAERGWEY